MQPFVTVGERNHAQRFVHAEDAARHLVGRALVRRVLDATIGRPAIEEFTLSQYGKPTYATGEINFSISHAGDMVVAAFCIGHNVGIDIENIRSMPDLSDIVVDFHPIEANEILAEQGPERTSAFFHCWTRKEAVLKTAGTGLNQPLNSFRVRTDRTNQDWLLSFPHHRSS